MSFKPMTVGVVPAVDLYAEELDRIAELLYTEALDRIAELEAALAERTRERDEAIRRAETEARCAARYRWLFRHDDSPVSRVNRVWRAWDGCDGYYGWNRAIDAARAETPR